MKIKFKKLHPDAIIPTKAHNTDAGIDFYALKEIWINPLDRQLIKTGIAWEPVKDEFAKYENMIPYLQLMGRSGLAYRNGIDVLAGVVDESYRGDISFVLFNSSSSVTIYIGVGDKIGQGIVLWTPVVHIEEVEELSDTERGGNGFGSTN